MRVALVVCGFQRPGPLAQELAQRWVQSAPHSAAVPVPVPDAAAHLQRRGSPGMCAGGAGPRDLLDSVAGTAWVPGMEGMAVHIPGAPPDGSFDPAPHGPPVGSLVGSLDERLDGPLGGTVVADLPASGSAAQAAALLAQLAAVPPGRLVLRAPGAIAPVDHLTQVGELTQADELTQITDLYDYLDGGGQAPRHCEVAYSNDASVLGVRGAAAGAQPARPASAAFVAGVRALEARAGRTQLLAGTARDTTARNSSARNTSACNTSACNTSACNTSACNTSAMSNLPGTAAAGGLAFALALHGYQLRPWAGIAADIVGVASVVAAADLCVLVVPEASWELVEQGAGARAATVARQAARPVIVVAGTGGLSRREWATAGISGLYLVDELVGPEPHIPASRIERLARTWSPAPG